MQRFPWQIQSSMQAIIFDCDSTLSSIEGIDALAAHTHASSTVSSLTESAMNISGINPTLYQQRLELVQPTKTQVTTLGDQYFSYRVPDIIEIIQLFQRLNKSIYIISSGFYPAVARFAEQLGIAKNHVYAVQLHFDQSGNYLDFDHTSPLIHNHGKREIIAMLQQDNQRIAYIGDGLNDLAAMDIVTRFIGYGGVCYRENIAKHCQYYLATTSMTPILPLCLTHEEYTVLTPSERALFQMGLDAIEQGDVMIKN